MTVTEALDILAFEPDNELAAHELIEAMPGETDDERLRQAAIELALNEANLTASIIANGGSVAKTFQNLGDRHFIHNRTNELYYQCPVCDKKVNHKHFKKHLKKHNDAT